MMNRIASGLIGLAVLGLSASALAGSYAKSDSKNIIETAQSAGQFATLLTAIEVAGLTDALSGKGPFTVFAPTDEAFAAVPAEQLQALLADQEALTSVLTYHVVSGKVKSTEVVKLDRAETLQGSTVAITADDAGVRVDNANVTAVDMRPATA